MVIKFKSFDNVDISALGDDYLTYAQIIKEEIFWSFSLENEINF